MVTTGHHSSLILFYFMSYICIFFGYVSEYLEGSVMGILLFIPFPDSAEYIIDEAVMFKGK